MNISKTMGQNKIIISVIVPAYNAKNYLRLSLPAIKKTDYKYYELIVVDDNSTDGTLDLSRKYADNVIHLKKREASAKARNRGVEESQGSVLFFVDADVVIKPASIPLVAKFMKENQNIGAVFGSYDDKPSCKDFFSQYKNLFHHYIHQKARTEASTFWAGCGAIRKNIFVEAGGFPEKYKFPAIEDVELGYNLAVKGIKIRLLKELQVQHLKKWNFFNLLKTDIVQRAIPWTKLSLERKLPFDLNFKLSDRASGALAFLLIVSFFGIFWKVELIILLMMNICILFYLNRRLYQFFLQKKGFLFTVLSVLYHWLYLFYSTATFGLFTLVCSVQNIFKKRNEVNS